jgi:alpha-N-acetylglucosaminidase
MTAANSSDARSAAARAGIRRLSGLDDSQLDVSIDEDAAADSFRVHAAGGVLHVRATSPAVALAGYAQFARRTGIGSVSRSGIRRPEALPETAEVAATSPFAARIAYNMTVSGYTTPFFDWDDWEAELDLLAASGITAAHITLGQEAVWLEAFQEFGYSEAELLDWIVPPSHQPWQWLNNIQSFGGGTTLPIIRKRVALARRVFGRMAELEITPILPGFSGTVPQGFEDRNPGAPIVPQGKWFLDIAGPIRPDWLSSESEHYARVAASFYAAQQSLFGLGGHWAVDLLHEGGKIGDSTLAEAAQGVERAMRAADPGYTWYVQAWAGNPRQELLDALDTSRLFVLDLIGEHWATMEGYGSIPWAWGILPNYGGRNGLYGDLAAIAAAPATLFGGEAPTGALRGLTDMAEGVANNPVVWDLFHDLTWTDRPIDLSSWLDEWIAARYGALTPAARDGWAVLRNSAYGPWRVPESAGLPKETVLAVIGQPVDAATVDSVELPEGMSAMFGDDAESGAEALEMFSFYSGTDSVIAAVPSLGANQASTMGPRVLPYAPEALKPALTSLVRAADELDRATATAGRSASFDYDLVDVARQALADAARALLARVAAAYTAGDLSAFDTATGTFLALIDEQERVLGTLPQFRLDTWVESARSFGGDDGERAQLVEWAKRLVTSWGEREDFVLSEYSNRDWAGLVGGYYRHRWELWFAELRKVLAGQPTTPIDWYDVAHEWVTTDTPATAASGDPLEAARSALAFLDSL